MLPQHPDTTLAEHYTVSGDERVEARIGSDMEHAARRLREAFSGDDLRSVVLFGGYGRGEGGALIEGDEAKPHNNYDLLIVLGQIPLARRKELAARGAAVSEELAKAFGLGIDLIVRSIAFLKRPVNILINHDLRTCHKVIWGEEGVLSVMPDYSQMAIPMMEGATMLRNRGTCLLINRLMLAEKTTRREEDRQQFIRHMFKAIIGLGDAILIAKGRYVSGYQDKLAKIEAIALDEIPQADALKMLYREAAAFRFLPDYPKYLRRDFADWLDQLLAVFEPIHLWFERVRLDQEQLTWPEHFHRLSGFGFDVNYGILKRVRNVAVNLRAFGLLEALGPRGWWYGRHPRDRMLAAFPALLYRPEGWDFLADIHPLLGTQGDWTEAANGYLAFYKRLLTA